MTGELIIFSNIVFAPIVGLIVILIDFYSRRPADVLQKRLFTLIVTFTLAAILCDIVYTAVAGVPGRIYVTANLMVCTLYFFFKALAFSFLFLFYEYIFKGSFVRMKKMIIALVVVNLINFVLLFFNIFTQKLFYITHNNIYVRGDWYPLLIFIFYIIMVVLLISIFTNQKNITRNLLILALLSVLPGITGTTFDIIIAESRSIWPSFFISVLFYYLFIIRMTSIIDSLTNIYNRRGFDEHLQSIFKSSRHKDYAIIMIDMDRFKEINDNFGHAQGDAALRDAAEILRNSVRRSDFVARYGGDEFVVIAAASNADAIIKNIMAKFQEFNLRKSRPYTLALSCGGDVYRQDDPRTPPEFLSHIDSLMYAQKEKERRGRK